MRALVILLSAASVFAAGSASGQSPLDNPAIDMQAHLRLALEAAEHRESRRLTEEQFLAMRAEPGTVVLDARSRDKYDELHVSGAVSLPFPDITVESLARVLPDKSARILIYCNNNFSNAEGPFPTKIAPASLNLSTYVTLYEYGYRNVYELGPLLDATTTRIPFEGTLAGAAAAGERPMDTHANTPAL